MNKIYLLCAFLLLSQTIAQAANSGAHFKRVITIVFENEDYDSVITQQEFAAFAKQGVLLTSLTAEAHPSQGNYIAMIAGDSYGIRNDKNIDLSYQHIGDLLENAGLDWKVYAEAYPGNCYTGASSGTYFRKHNPFISFTNVSGNAARCEKIVNANQFDQDLNSNALPAYSFYVPDIKNDGHDTGVSFAGKWLKNRFGALFAKPDFLKDTLIILTFDEASNHSASNQVYTVLIGGSVKIGAQNSQALTHTSLLRLIEEEFSLGSLNRLDAKSDLIQGIWR